MSSSKSGPITLSSLKFVTPTTVAQSLLNPTEKAKIAIIDVRDSDHVGGNINGSQWVPEHQVDTKMPELLRTLKDKEKVIFHCMLSQQRGPKAALAYANAKQRADKEAQEQAKAAETKSNGGRGEEATLAEAGSLRAGGRLRLVASDIRRGFEIDSGLRA